MQATEDLIRLCSSAAQPDQVFRCLPMESLNISISLIVKSVKRDMVTDKLGIFGGNTGKSFIFCWYDAIIYALNYSRNKVILESDCYIFGEMTDYTARLWFHCSWLFLVFRLDQMIFFLSLTGIRLPRSKIFPSYSPNPHPRPHTHHSQAHKHKDNYS